MSRILDTGRMGHLEMRTVIWPTSWDRHVRILYPATNTSVIAKSLPGVSSYW